MASIPFRTSESRRQLRWLLLALIWMFGLSLAWPGSLIGDEWVHYHQIAGFRKGDFTVLVQWLTTIPGYHWAVAIVLFPFGTDSPAAARIVNAAFGVGALIAFFALRSELHRADAARATAQLALLPIVFPFYFLIYTDVLSLALILSAALATSKQRHVLAALVLTAAIGVRQNNVLWAGFLVSCAVWPILIAHRGAAWRRWREVIGVASPYSIPIVGFVLYWMWNGSVAYSGSQSAMHPDMAIHAGNPFFALFLLAILMPLHVGAGLLAFARRAAQRPLWWLFPLAVFAVFSSTFVIDHDYNHIALEVNVRNAWLMMVKEQAWA